MILAPVPNYFLGFEHENENVAIYSKIVSYIEIGKYWEIVGASWILFYLPI